MKNNYSNLSNTYNSNLPIYDEVEVFYYNNGIPSSDNTIGFTYEEAINIGLDNDWPIATHEQIFDAYNNGIDIPTCLWGWGYDRRKYWCSKAVGLICDGYKSGFYIEEPKPNEKCGIFFYAIKPQESSNIVNCLTTTTNQHCVLPWRNGLNQNQWSKYSPPFIDCYQEGENPFEQKCLKSSCCEGTSLRLHPPDTTHKIPYYICSSNTSYPANIPANCEKNLSQICLNSSFCYKQPTDKYEVFYYTNGGRNNIDLGFTFWEAINIGQKENWQLATNQQLWDAYQDGADIPTCLWGWGYDGRKHWFSRTVGITCNGYNEYKSPGFYTEIANADGNDKCGIFFYGIKPLEYANCLLITSANQPCIVPWCDGLNQWSKYSPL